MDDVNSDDLKILGEILIVDDTPENLQLLSVMLVSRGHKVRLSPNGKLALLNTQNSPPDLILLDINMPDMNGFEVCERLKSDPHTRDIPIIFISALDRAADKVEAFRLGGVDYITKPFNVREVLARVTTHLKLRRLQTQLTARVHELEIALAQVNQLEGLLPICSYCQRVRDDQDYWQRVETYISDRTDASFSHGICPDCYDTKVRPQIEALRKKRLGQGE
jgi:PleD family two-component response regulator